MRRRTVDRFEQTVKAAIFASIWCITSAMVVVGLASM